MDANLIFQNNLTGEHTCIMLRMLNDEEISHKDDHWLQSYWTGSFLIVISISFIHELRKGIEWFITSADCTLHHDVECLF